MRKANHPFAAAAAGRHRSNPSHLHRLALCAHNSETPCASPCGGLARGREGPRSAQGGGHLPQHRLAEGSSASVIVERRCGLRQRQMRAFAMASAARRQAAQQASEAWRPEPSFSSQLNWPFLTPCVYKQGLVEHDSNTRVGAAGERNATDCVDRMQARTGLLGYGRGCCAGGIFVQHKFILIVCCTACSLRLIPYQEESFKACPTRSLPTAVLSPSSPPCLQPSASWHRERNANSLTSARARRTANGPIPVLPAAPSPRAHCPCEEQSTQGQQVNGGKRSKQPRSTMLLPSPMPPVAMVRAAPGRAGAGHASICVPVLGGRALPFLLLPPECPGEGEGVRWASIACGHCHTEILVESLGSAACRLSGQRTAPPPTASLPPHGSL